MVINMVMMSMVMVMYGDSCGGECGDSRNKDGECSSASRLVMMLISTE